MAVTKVGVESPEELMKDLTAAKLQFHSELQIVDVPASCPRTYDEFATWKKYWPITYHDNHERCDYAAPTCDYVRL